MGDVYKEGGLRYRLVLYMPMIIASIVLGSIYYSLGEQAFNNLGVLTIHMVYRIGIIVLGVEVINQIVKKRGGLKNE